MSWGLENPFVQVGLTAIAVFFVVEYTKPSALYDEKTGQPKYELLTPCTLAAAAGLLVLAFNYKKLGQGNPHLATRAAVGSAPQLPPAEAGLTPETFGAETVDATRLSDLPNWNAASGAPEDILPMSTFTE